MRFEAGEVLGGKYRLVRPIGSGGMGTVYEAVHAELGTLFAVKVLSASFHNEPSAIARFHREAKLASSIRHDNICEVLDYGVTPEGTPYIVMPLLRGEPLSQILARRPLRVQRLLDIACQTLEALAAAHDRRIVHRDLKPENIFVTQVGDRLDFVKLLDFGVSKLQGGARESQPPLTEAGAVPGTPSYMAPEQARGLDDYDHRVDIYAMGVVLYEGVTGRRPFEGSSFNSILFRIVSDPFPAPRAVEKDVPPELEAVILDAMARDPSERFASARLMRQALSKVAALPGVAALELYGGNRDVGAPRSTTSRQTAATLQHTPTPPRMATQPPPGSRARVLGLLAGAVATLAIAGLWFGVAAQPSPPLARSSALPNRSWREPTSLVALPARWVLPALPPSTSIEAPRPATHRGKSHAPARATGVQPPPEPSGLVSGRNDSLISKDYDH